MTYMIIILLISVFSEEYERALGLEVNEPDEEEKKKVLKGLIYTL